MIWEQAENKLEKEFYFNNFTEALQFLNQVGSLAERLNHHPDLLLHAYKQVKITLTTHSKGKVTKKDYELAKQIDQISR